MTDLFEAQKEQVMERLEEKAGDRDLFTTDELFAIGQWVQETTTRMAEGVRQAMIAGFQFGSARIDHQGPFPEGSPKVRQVMEAVNRQARGIPQTTRRRINMLVQQGLEDNLTFEEMAARIDEQFEEVVQTRHRSRVIAQTTGTAGFETGQLQSFQEAGVTEVQWLSQRDGRVRSGHREADGQVRQVGEPFEVAAEAGGTPERLRFPADPRASAANAAGCRCSLVPTELD